jgi:hypothetical protein
LVESTNNGRYVNIWVIATPILNKSTGLISNDGIGFIVGQREYTSLALANAESFYELDLTGFSSEEIAPLYQITFRHENSYDDVSGNVRIESVRRIVGTKYVSGSLIASSNVHNNLAGRSELACHPGTSIALDVTNFNGNLDSTDVDVQKLADKFDDFTMVSGVLSEQIITTISDGGISSGVTLPQGMTFTEYVKAAHAPYTPPSFTAFAINGNISGTLEVGQVLTITNATFTQTNDSAGNPPSDKQIIGTGFESATLVTTSPHNADAVTKTVTRLLAGNESWSIIGKDANNVNISRLATRTWYFRFKFGASSIDITDITSAQNVYNALQQSWLQANKTRVVICTLANQDVDNKTLIVYPKVFGLLSNIIQNGALPVLSAFTLIDEYIIVNSFGISETHYFYVSNATGAFIEGTSLAIS